MPYGMQVYYIKIEYIYIIVDINRMSRDIRAVSLTHQEGKSPHYIAAESVVTVTDF